MKLTSENVDSVFRDCLFGDDEPTDPHVAAPGICHPVGFHPDRLESHRAEILDMLDELPSPFRESSGGGWSFLNACQTKSGEQWADLHLRMEQLFQLGTAIGRVKCLFPREMWPVLPGGVPYYVVTDGS